MSAEGDDLAELFRQEANALVETLSRTLLNLERDERADEARTESMRHFHTLKGMANMEGHADLARLCHDAETLLSRGGRPPVDDLLRRVDEVRAWLRAHGLAVTGAAPDPDAPGVAYVSVQTDRLDRLLNIAGELTVTSTRLAYEGREGAVAPETLRALGGLVRDLQDEVMRTRLIPARTLFASLPRLARDAANARGVQVDLDLDEGSIGLDRSIVDRLGGVLAHLVQNSIAHGIEPPEERRAAGKGPRGRIRVRLHRHQDTVTLRLEDDGRGLDHAAIRAEAVARGLWTPTQAAEATPAEVTDVLFAPGFSTSRSADKHAGRGIGLTAARETVRELGGSLALDSAPGKGTAVIIHLPPTVALLETLVARAGGATLAVPVRNVRRIHSVAEARSVSGALLLLDGQAAIPLLDARGRPAQAASGRFAIVVEAAHGTFALVVDELLGTHSTLLKPLDPHVLAAQATAMGAAVLGSGTLAIVIDPNHFQGKV
ncbi:MAG TPA: ATP-binding protein [Candidatus Thermoplasmatota archaeon]|nr:ATP-binding protein [Candidatus Thermoplasmatota archaeon]